MLLLLLPSSSCSCRGAGDCRPAFFSRIDLRRANWGWSPCPSTTENELWSRPWYRRVTRAFAHAAGDASSVVLRLRSLVPLLLHHHGNDAPAVPTSTCKRSDDDSASSVSKRDRRHCCCLSSSSSESSANGCASAASASVRSCESVSVPSRQSARRMSERTVLGGGGGGGRGGGGGKGRVKVRV